MSGPPAQRVAACPHCEHGDLQLRLGYAARPPDETTPVTEMGDGWNSAALQVIETFILFCTAAPETCTRTAVAAIGLDEQGNQVAPEPGVTIHQVQTDPWLIVLTDDQVAMMSDDE